MNPFWVDSVPESHREEADVQQVFEGQSITDPAQEHRQSRKPQYLAIIFLRLKNPTTKWVCIPEKSHTLPSEDEKLGEEDGSPREKNEAMAVCRILDDVANRLRQT